AQQQRPERLRVVARLCPRRRVAAHLAPSLSASVGNPGARPYIEPPRAGAGRAVGRVRVALVLRERLGGGVQKPGGLEAQTCPCSTTSSRACVRTSPVDGRRPPRQN